MANSISLSSDMKTLYMMPAGAGSVVDVFSLAGNGVYITSIVGNIQVVLASKPLPNGADEFSIVNVAQWQAAFHENTNSLSMIGSEDVENGVNAESKLYDLSGGNTYNLRLNSNQTKLLLRTA